MYIAINLTESIKIIRLFKLGYIRKINLIMIKINNKIINSKNCLKVKFNLNKKCLQVY